MLVPRKIKHRKQHHPKRSGRKGLDQHIPGPSIDQEASRDSYGFRKGITRMVGREHQARSRHVRDLRRNRRHRKCGDDSCDSQTSSEVPRRPS